MVLEHSTYTLSDSAYETLAELETSLSNLTSLRRLQQNPNLMKGFQNQAVRGSISLEKALSLRDPEDANSLLCKPAVLEHHMVLRTFQLYGSGYSLFLSSKMDLLAAHRTLLKSLHDNAGEFRSGTAGVRDKDGSVLYEGISPEEMPDVVTQILSETSDSSVPYIVRAVLVQGQLMQILPFSFGNITLSLLWMRVLLSRKFAQMDCIPFETRLYSLRMEYIQELKRVHDTGDYTRFIDFMLAVLKDTLHKTCWKARKLSSRS